MKTVGKQISAINTHPSTVMYVKANPFSLHLVRDFMEDANFKDCHPFYWYKPTLQQRGMKKYSHAVEAGCVGYLGGRSNAQFNNRGLLANPVYRQNIVQAKRVLSYYKSADNDQPVNTTETNPQLAYHFADQHTLTGDWALVIGGGSGADVIGCLAAGCNVVVLDREESMVSGMIQRFNELCVLPPVLAPSLPLGLLYKLGDALHKGTKHTKEGLIASDELQQKVVDKLPVEILENLQGSLRVQSAALSKKNTENAKKKKKSK